jgi:hypothetical protein
MEYKTEYKIEQGVSKVFEVNIAKLESEGWTMIQDSMTTTFYKNEAHFAMLMWKEIRIK